MDFNEKVNDWSNDNNEELEVYIESLKLDIKTAALKLTNEYNKELSTSKMIENVENSLNKIDINDRQSLESLLLDCYKHEKHLMSAQTDHLKEKVAEITNCTDNEFIEINNELDFKMNNLQLIMNRIEKKISENSDDEDLSDISNESSFNDDECNFDSDSNQGDMIEDIKKLKEKVCDSSNIFDESTMVQKKMTLFLEKFTKNCF